jgi:hypothetical protein
MVRTLDEDRTFVIWLDKLGLPGSAEMFEQAAVLSSILCQCDTDTRPNHILRPSRARGNSVGAS